MKIVLLERIHKLGKMGEVVTVKDGFARNYLIPYKKAMRATDQNIAYFEKERALLESQSLDLQTKAEGLAKKLQDVKLFIVRQTSESGLLYGSVSARDIAKEVSVKHHSLNHTHVRMDQPLKNSGVHTVKLQLHPEVVCEIIVSIAPSEEEAKLQLQKPVAKILPEAETIDDSLEGESKAEKKKNPKAKKSVKDSKGQE